MTSLLRSIAFIAAALISSLAVSAADKPDVLFIAIDDLNDWIGCLNGHPQVKTPHIDALAARGMLFTNAHCQSPLCNPSRASLLLSLRPSTTGIYGLAPGFRRLDTYKDRVTIPQHFAANGYATFCAGKIHHDGSIAPKERGKEFEVWEQAGRMPYPSKKIVTTPDNMAAMDWGIFPENDEFQADWQIADAAIAHLKKRHDKPLFTAVGFRLPHVPCFASRKWFDLYPENGLVMPPVLEEDRKDVPAFAWYLHWKLPEPRLSWLKQAEQWRPLVRSYLATTSFMDSQVGRVLEALKESGREANTIVVLWSDHGWHLGEKGITGKNTLWERSTRVPLMFAGPGVAKGKCDQPAELLDLYPTLIDLSGLPLRTDLEGISLLPQLKDGNNKRDRPAITTHNQGNHAVRSQRWRYIRYADGSQELYDLREDPNEWKNLAGDAAHAAVIAEHAKWLPKTDAAPAPGSAHRVLVKQGDQWLWEGKAIKAEEKVE